MRPSPDPHSRGWRGRRDGPGWRHGLLLVLVDEVVDSWRVLVSTVEGKRPNDVAMERVRTALRLGDATEEETPIGDARFLVLSKVLEDYPWDTTGAVFRRESTDSPWRLSSLFTGDSRRYDVHDAGWNSGYEANLYAMSGSGPGLPYLGKLTPAAVARSGLEAVWSRHGWCDGGQQGKLPADPEAFGYLVLEELPDIPLQECGRILYCETCEEGQDADGNQPCDHIWWCGTAPGWMGAVNYPASKSPCVDEYCDCHYRDGTQQLYAVPLLWAHGKPWC